MGTRKRQPKQETPSNAASEAGTGKHSSEANESEDGFESLRSAADRQLGKNSSKIAEALGKKAAGGDLNSAKFLVAVVEKKAGKGAPKKRRGPSAVERLLLEPAWEEPLQSDEESEPAQ